VIDVNARRSFLKQAANRCHTATLVEVNRRRLFEDKITRRY